MFRKCEKHNVALKLCRSAAVCFYIKYYLEVGFVFFFISAEICITFSRAIVAGVQASQMQITGPPVPYTLVLYPLDAQSFPFITKLNIFQGIKHIFTYFRKQNILHIDMYILKGNCSDRYGTVNDERFSV